MAVAAPSKPKADTLVGVRLTLPENVLAVYELQAKDKGVTVEAVIAERLRQCSGYTSIRPLYFSDSNRNKLESILGSQFNDTESVLLRLSHLVKIKVGAVSIILGQQLLDRCKSRASAFRISLEKWIEKEVVEGLERATGIRPY